MTTPIPNLNMLQNDAAPSQVVCSCGKAWHIRDSARKTTLKCKSCGQNLQLAAQVVPSEQRVIDNVGNSVPQEVTPSSHMESPTVVHYRVKSIVLAIAALCKIHGFSVAGSVVVHVVAALLLITVMLDRQQPLELQQIEAGFSLTQADDIEFDLCDDAALLEIETPLAESFVQLEPLDASVATAPSSNLPDLNPELQFDSQLSEKAASATASRSDKGTGRRKTGIGPGGDGIGDGGTSFFGKKISVKSVAYVIDASGSMTGQRFVRARLELANALSQMTKTQQFFIVFYSDKTYPLFWPEPVVSLIPASKGNLHRTGQWLERSMPSGGTQPQMAMSLALGLKPDVIFLLSDGDIPAETISVVSVENKGSVIHTIALGSEDGSVVMRKIAEENDGEFRLISDIP